MKDLRHQGDTIADNLIQEIYSNYHQDEINALFLQLTSNSSLSNIEIPDYTRNYFATTSVLPPWVDWKKVRRGQRFYMMYGPEISFILLCKSLPQCYACANGAKVMASTGRFSERKGDFDFYTRRIVETSQFIVNVMSPDALSVDGQAVVDTQKVRLIHAAIRFFLQKKGHWDNEKYGVPINQEDLLGTLMSFSALVIEGLEQLGMDVSDEQKDSYYHCWRIIGYILGIREENMPERYEDALKLGYEIFNEQMEESDDGKALTKSTIEFMEKVIPGNFFDSIPPFLMRFFIGDKVGDLLDVPKHDSFLNTVTEKLMLFYYKNTDEVKDNFQLAQGIFEAFNNQLLNALLNYYSDGNSRQFFIPPSLRSNWQLENVWDKVYASPKVGKYRFVLQKYKL